ncbi:MAG: alpha-E domain-containing protein [Kiloniellales bacterium]
MSRLLSRYAKATFWMARYVERAENLARVLDVQETFSRDSRGGQNWRSVLQLYADEERFLKNHKSVEAEDVIRFYILEQENPASILACIKMARENARTLRALISTEMWVQLNMYFAKLRSLTPQDVAEPRLGRICMTIKEACQTHTGITEGTFYRDEGWHFYQLGRLIERADQTTRLLDVKYHLLLPSPSQVGSPFDVSQWNAVLRSASGFHAFRRLYPSGMSPATVTGFLLFDRGFPRSVMACVSAIEETLTRLRARYSLRRGVASQERLDLLRTALEEETSDSIIGRGLHEFLDGIQLALIQVSEQLGRDFFGDPPPEEETGAEAGEEAGGEAEPAAQGAGANA